jgi:hypothetical protein
MCAAQDGTTDAETMIVEKRASGSRSHRHRLEGEPQAAAFAMLAAAVR